jgi:hypothetical protein
MLHISSRGRDAKTVAAPSLPLAVIPLQRNNCSSVPYVRTSFAGCKLRNQINTSDNDSIATFDLKFPELGLQLTIVEIANPPHLRDTLQIESKVAL